MIGSLQELRAEVRVVPEHPDNDKAGTYATNPGTSSRYPLAKPLPGATVGGLNSTIGSVIAIANTASMKPPGGLSLDLLLLRLQPSKQLTGVEKTRQAWRRHEESPRWC